MFLLFLINLADIVVETRHLIAIRFSKILKNRFRLPVLGKRFFHISCHPARGCRI